MSFTSKNSMWFLGLNIGRMIFVSLGTILASRILGPSQFGDLSYLISIFTFTMTLDSLCHESVIKKLILEAQDDSQKGEILGSIAGFGALLTAFAILILLGFGYFLLEDPKLMFPLAILCLGTLNKPFTPISYLFDSQLLSKYSSLALFIATVLSILFRVIALAYSTDIAYQTFGYALQTLFTGILLYYFYKKLKFSYQFSYSLSCLMKIIKSSIPTFLSSSFFVLMGVSDIFLIQTFYDSHAVGIYSVVVRLSEPWVIISTAICVSIFPSAIRNSHDLVVKDKLFVKANAVSNVIVIALGIFLFFTIDFFVNTLHGPQYSESAAVLKIYFWGVLFLFWANIQHIWEVSNRYFKILLYRTLFAVALKLPLSFVLGLNFGLRGFAIATLLSYFFYTIGFNLLYKKMKPYWHLQLKSLSLSSLIAAYNLILERGLMWKRKEF